MLERVSERNVHIYCRLSCPWFVDVIAQLWSIAQVMDLYRNIYVMLVYFQLPPHDGEDSESLSSRAPAFNAAARTLSRTTLIRRVAGHQNEKSNFRSTPDKRSLLEARSCLRIVQPACVNLATARDAKARHQFKHANVPSRRRRAPRGRI